MTKASGNSNGGSGASSGTGNGNDAAGSSNSGGGSEPGGNRGGGSAGKTGSGARANLTGALPGDGVTTTTAVDGIVDALGVGLGADAGRRVDTGGRLTWLWWLLLVATAVGTGLAWSVRWRRREHGLATNDEV